jgi:CRISPR-associated protein Csx10
MYRITYRITTQSPVVLSTNSGETHLVTTRDFIPGTVVLGMCAGRYIEKNIKDKDAHRDENFYNWFIGGSLVFGNGYIDPTNDKDKKKRNNPVPLSIHQDKHKKTQGFDLLLQVPENQTSAIGGYGRVEFDGDEGEEENDMEVPAGYLYKQPVKKSLNYHHQHDPEKGTVRKGKFFNYEAVEAGQTFTGDIFGKQDVLEAFVNSFSKEETFYIGRSRNTQYGKIDFSIKTGLQTSETKDEALKIRGGEITLTLISDLIIYNECGMSTTDIKVLKKTLQEFTGNENLSIKKSFIKPGDIENFVSVWKLKRPSETCFKAGSCFVLQELSEADKTRLLELKETGIGERRHEGFGRIDFMRHRSPLLRINEHEEKKKRQPQVETGETTLNLTKEILLSIIKNGLRQQVELEAIRESGDFKNLPSKSLIGRLESFPALDGKKGLDFDVSHFQKNVSDKLRKTARDSLEKCRNRDNTQTLLGFITKKSLSIEDIRRSNTGYIKELNKFVQAGFNKYIEENGQAFESELYLLYFRTFFAVMRKRIKASEEGRK